MIHTVFGNVIPSGAAFTDLFLEFGGAGNSHEQSESINDMDFHEQLLVGTSVTVSTSFSVGYVIWMLRGGSLMTAFMSSLPAWQSFDPLPILDSHSSRTNDEDEEEETLVSLVS